MINVGFLHTEKTSESMASTLDNLQEILGKDYFKLFSLLLTDRGTEFEKYELFELKQELEKYELISFIVTHKCLVKSLM